LSDWTGHLSARQRIVADWFIHEFLVPTWMPEAMALEDLVLILAGRLAPDPEMTRLSQQLAAWCYASMLAPDDQEPLCKCQVARCRRLLAPRACDLVLAVVAFLYELCDRRVLVIHNGAVHRGRTFFATGS